MCSDDPLSSDEGEEVLVNPDKVPDESSAASGESLQLMAGGRKGRRPKGQQLLKGGQKGGLCKGKGDVPSSQMEKCSEMQKEKLGKKVTSHLLSYDLTHQFFSNYMTYMMSSAGGRKEHASAQAKAIDISKFLYFAATTETEKTAEMDTSHLYNTSKNA